jgi:ketosteroid isomerase-like protein
METPMPDDQPIRQALAAYQAAILAKDVDAFMAIYADDVRIFELWNRWEHDNASWREMATGWFGFLGEERSVVEAHGVRTQVATDMALLSASLTYRAVDEDGRELRSLDNRLSWVLRQRGGRWLVVHEHTSVPLAMDGAKGILKRPATP